MSRAGRTTLVLEGALWLAAAALVAAMIWLRWHPLPPASRRYSMSPTQPRAVRAYIKIVPRIGSDSVSVVALYTLTKDWGTNRFTIAPLFRSWSHAVAYDSEGPLATSILQPGTEEPRLGVLLHDTRAGSSLVVSYEARTWFTGMYSVGKVWLGMGGMDAVRDITWVVPHANASRSEIPPIHMRAETRPRPDAVWAGAEGTYVQFRDLMPHEEILLSYEPAGGLSPFCDQRMVRIVPLDDRDHTFVVHYPRQVEDVALDVCDFAERMFPLLVDEVGAMPVEHRTDVLLRPGTPISEYCVAYHDSVHHHVNIYLQRLGLRPSIFMGHEMLHGYVQGRVPTYLEEGLVEHFNQRLLWRAGIDQWSGPIWLSAHHFDRGLLLRKGYGRDGQAIRRGYYQGEQLMDLMFVQMPGREIDLPLELFLHLRDRRATLQTAVASVDHGRDLYRFLDSYGLGDALRPPELCTRADVIEGETQPDRYAHWLPSWPISLAVVFGAFLLLLFPMSAPIVFIAALCIVVPIIPAYGHPPQMMIKRFIPVLVAGIIEGALGTRIAVAFFYAPLWRRLGITPRKPSVLRGIVLNALVLMVPLACLAVPLWGPALMPAYTDGMEQLAIVLFSLGALLTAPLALVELRIGGYVP